jgi:cytochrome P450
MATTAGRLADRPTTDGIGSLTSTFDVPPFEYYEQLRSRGDLVWDHGQECWLATSYAAVKEIALQDKALWANPLGRFDPEFPPFGTSYDQWTRYAGGPHVIQQVDDSAHDRMHRWWMRAFSPKVLARWGEDLVDPIVRSTIAPIAQRGRAELSTEYAQVVTLRSVAAVLGLPYDLDWLQKFSSAGARILAVVAGGLQHVDPHKAAASANDIADSLAGSDEFQGMIMEYVEAHVAKVDLGQGDVDSPSGVDFIGLLWHSRDDLFGTSDFTAEDVRGHAFQAVIASMESIGGAARNGCYLLATHPELHERVRTDQEAANNFVEETLRLHGSVEFRPRRALADLELAGMPIKRGEIVISLIGCANRDPARYDRPYEVDLDRRAPRDHFGFFQGPHMCAGQNLARFLLQRIFRPTLEQITDLRLDPDAEQPRYVGRLSRRWEPLNVLFTASDAVS